MADFSRVKKSKNVQDFSGGHLFGVTDAPRQNPMDGRANAKEDISNTWQAKTTPSQSNKEYKQDPEVIAQKIESGSIGDLIKKLGKKGK